MKDRLSKPLKEALNYVGEEDLYDQWQAYHDQEMQRVVDEYDKKLEENYQIGRRIEIRKYEAKVKQLEETIKHKDEHIDDITQNALNEWNILEGRLLNRQERCNEAEAKVKQLEQRYETLKNCYDQDIGDKKDKIKRLQQQIKELVSITEEQNDTIILVNDKNKELEQQIKESRGVDPVEEIRKLNGSMCTDILKESREVSVEELAVYFKECGITACNTLAVETHNLIYGDKQGE